MIADAETRVCPPPKPLGRLPRARLPEGTVDAHFHVFKADAPLNSPRSYTPHIVTLHDWRSYADAVGIKRGVLVQPSVYGVDNSVLLEALSSDPANLRGIVVVPAGTSIGALRRLDGLGVRGVRINTRNQGGLPFEAVAELAASCSALGWILEFQVKPEQLPTIASLMPTLGAPVVIDHFGFIPLGTGETEGHLAALQRLLDGPEAYVKLSAPYRLASAPEAIARITARFAASHPDRLIWGSDWPHTEMWDAVPDDADLIDEMWGWLGTDALRSRVFASTSGSLFFSR